MLGLHWGFFFYCLLFSSWNKMYKGASTVVKWIIDLCGTHNVSTVFSICQWDGMILRSVEISDEGFMVDQHSKIVLQNLNVNFNLI